MVADSSKSSSQPDFGAIGLVICGLMFLCPPWTENPSQLHVGDIPVSYDGRGFDYISNYILHPLSPIKNSTQPEYRLLWDPPSKRFSSHTSIGIAWGRLFLQWGLVAIVLGLIAISTKAETAKIEAEAARVEAAKIEAETARAKAAKIEAEASNDLITRVPANSQSTPSAIRTTPIRQTPSPEGSIRGESDSGKKGLLGCAAILTFLLAMSVYGVLTAPGLKVSIGVGLLIYGAMFGIPLILVIKAFFKSKN